ncbi:UDP-glucosyltransferase 2-like [Amyelois transitella]|uniref:UDP-glucosyltransferase 2-like n=1 Tax=Amyelois transitella TaxID=680683 RepID=UPI00067DFBB2|nr:UDP-glucosyltransferase 2-like [Amyelois transitella]
MMSDIKYNSLYDKYEAIFSSIAWSNLFAENDKVLHEDFKKIFPELPPLTELKDNVDMLMVNMYPLWEGVHPYPPNSALFKFNGRIGQEIPEEFQTYLDSSKDGVIYASFGTSVSFSTLSRDIIASILRGFSTLPYEVLLKCDTDELAVLDRPKNVKLFKLLPQPDILRHPKIKLFITQGGLHSIDEAIDAGVPLVVIPTKFDQFANAERCVDNGIGVKLDINTISEQKLIDAIKTVVEDKRFGDNIKKLRAILQDNPMKSMDRLLWAIEYTTRHRGAKHLRTPSANMSWAEFFELELLETKRNVPVSPHCSEEKEACGAFQV